MTQVDFHALNRELSEAAAVRRAPLPRSFDSFFFSDFLGRKTALLLSEAEGSKDIDYYFDLDDRGPKLLAKKLIRKANKFLFLRNVDAQRRFNDSLLQANAILQRRLDAVQRQLGQEIRSLEERLHKMEGRARPDVGK